MYVLVSVDDLTALRNIVIFHFTIVSHVSATPCVMRRTVCVGLASRPRARACARDSAVRFCQRTNHNHGRRRGAACTVYTYTRDRRAGYCGVVGWRDGVAGEKKPSESL